MANLASVYEMGKAGLNKGLPTGIPGLDAAINGIQKTSSYGIAAAQKVGKTTFADYSFLLAPYLYIERLEKRRLGVNRLNMWNEEGTDFYYRNDPNSHWHNISWIYFSFEVDRVSKEFKMVSYFMYHDYGISSFNYLGKEYYMTIDYLQGKQLVYGSDEEIVPVIPEHEEMVKNIYIHRIIPIFGEYNKNGVKIRNGLVDFLDNKDNPTGMYKYIRSYARRHGTIHSEKFTIINEKGEVEEHSREVGYTENNPNLRTIIITDHQRKLKRERNFNMKDNIDKWLEYTTELRNQFFFTFVNLAHSNRGIANVERLKYMGEGIYPTADDVKDTGNLAEESTVLITLFNPNDEKYNLEKHFGYTLKDYPLYRSIHIADARNVFCPQHIFTNMYGWVNVFNEIKTS